MHSTLHMLQISLLVALLPVKAMVASGHRNAFGSKTPAACLAPELVEANKTIGYHRRRRDRKGHRLHVTSSTWLAICESLWSSCGPKTRMRSLALSDSVATQGWIILEQCIGPWSTGVLKRLPRKQLPCLK